MDSDMEDAYGYSSSSSDEHHPAYSNILFINAARRSPSRTAQPLRSCLKKRITVDVDFSLDPCRGGKLGLGPIEEEEIGHGSLCDSDSTTLGDSGNSESSGHSTTSSRSNSVVLPLTPPSLSLSLSLNLPSLDLSTPTPTPGPTPSSSQRKVHFPPQTQTYPTWSRGEYDRTPLDPPSEEERGFRLQRERSGEQSEHGEYPEEDRHGGHDDGQTKSNAWGSFGPVFEFGSGSGFTNTGRRSSSRSRMSCIAYDEFGLECGLGSGWGAGGTAFGTGTATGGIFDQSTCARFFDEHDLDSGWFGAHGSSAATRTGMGMGMGMGSDVEDEDEDNDDGEGMGGDEEEDDDCWEAWLDARSKGKMAMETEVVEVETKVQVQVEVDLVVHTMQSDSNSPSNTCQPSTTTTTHPKPTFPTPLYGQLPESVYEPAEDSFILLDALESDHPLILSCPPTICLEIGSGSGVGSSFLSSLVGPTEALFLSTDINPDACRATNRTAGLNGTFLNPVHAHLVDPLLQRLSDVGGADLIVFNPPYVPTEEDELTRTQLARGVGATWAGGWDGMMITDLVLDLLPRILARGGKFYLVAVSQNRPDEIIERMRARGFEGEVVLKRRAGRETLHVIRLIRQ
jgi:release factor glutamine methyltransferase